MTEKQIKELDKKIRIHQRTEKRAFATEQKILRYMKKTGVKFYHHGLEDELDIKKELKELKEQKPDFSSNDYWSRFSGKGASLLGCTWSSDEFETIYDVPLDGSYIFQVYDSGRRGLGATNNITAIKIDDKPYTPHVNPGGIPPITAN